ncbi:hypothetical protein, partial [Fibrobacter sp. UWB3]|uniref:hypothetical protein n=1 Tax=Fibrobacter sp. UWB3 TaxID=1964357 RepID=UPI001C3E8068
AGFTPRLTQHVGRGFFFFIPPAASTNRAGAPANPVVRCHTGLVTGRHRLTHLVTDLSDQFSMLFVFLCPHTDRAGNRTVMRTCNICTLNIPTWHIDKKSIKIAKK